MRRALILAALALPALGQAQTSGTVIAPTTDGNDKYINLEECDPSGKQEIELAWNVQLETGAALTSGEFRVFATSRTHPSGDAPYCPTEDAADDTYFAAQVGPNIVATVGQAIDSAMLPAADFVTASGRTCAAGADRSIYVCVHFHPYETGTTPATDPVGWAIGTLVLSTSSPAAPTGLTTKPGDTRIYASWTAPSGADRYRIEALEPGYDPVTNPTAKRTAEVRGTRDQEVGGLTNDVTYTVQVVALSLAGNPSGPSASVTETPREVDDFWDRYSSVGAEEGGCGAPGAGPLALLGLAALLARARRRS